MSAAAYGSSPRKQATRAFSSVVSTVPSASAAMSRVRASNTSGSSVSSCVARTALMASVALCVRTTASATRSPRTAQLGVVADAQVVRRACAERVLRRGGQRLRARFRQIAAQPGGRPLLDDGERGDGFGVCSIDGAAGLEKPTGIGGSRLSVRVACAEGLARERHLVERLPPKTGDSRRRKASRERRRTRKAAPSPRRARSPGCR